MKAPRSKGGAGHGGGADNKSIPPGSQCDPSRYARAPLYRPRDLEREWARYRALRAAERALTLLSQYRDHLEGAA